MLRVEKEASAVRHILKRASSPLLLAVVLVALTVVPAHAQDLQAQGLGRAYWHVFAAYAIAWAFVLGWIVSVARRLARLQQSLES